MLVSFSVSNFRSFASEQTFSLVASRRLSGMHDTHCVPIPDSDERVLRTGVLYGANGAGKSNLLAALSYVKSLALRAGKKGRGTGRVPFRLADMHDQPSTFDIQFVARNRLFQFGFSVDDDRVLEEWLVLVCGNKEKTIYERRTTKDGTVEIDSPGLKGSNEKLKALATIGGPQNQTFLATVRATLQPQDFGDEIAAALSWIDDDLVLVGPDSRPGFLGDALATRDNFRKFAGEFLKWAATGVDSLKVDKKELSSEEFHALFPPSQMPPVPEGNGGDETYVLTLESGPELVVQRTKDGDHYYRFIIQASHKHESQKEVALDLHEESDGTRRLLELTPALYHLQQAGRAVYFIDEIDRSMHPMLVYKFLEYFLTACTGTPCQIIVTTHETHLLNLDLLRRDEIWFAEKDPDGATNLYSLAEFNVRKDLHIQKHYLQGRFGAVPFLGDFNKLAEHHGEAAECR